VSYPFFFRLSRRRARVRCLRPTHATGVSNHRRLERRSAVLRPHEAGRRAGRRRKIGVLRPYPPRGNAPALVARIGRARQPTGSGGMARARARRRFTGRRRRQRIPPNVAGAPRHKLVTIGPLGKTADVPGCVGVLELYQYSYIARRSFGRVAERCQAQQSACTLAEKTKLHRGHWEEQDKIFPFSSKMSAKSDPLLNDLRWPGGRFKNTRRRVACNGRMEKCGHRVRHIREQKMTFVQNRFPKPLKCRLDLLARYQDGRYSKKPDGANTDDRRFVAVLLKFQVRSIASRPSPCFSSQFSARKAKVARGRSGSKSLTRPESYQYVILRSPFDLDHIPRNCGVSTTIVSLEGFTAVRG
jgi:hypothetical protein